MKHAWACVVYNKVLRLEVLGWGSWAGRVSASVEVGCELCVL